MVLNPGALTEISAARFTTTEGRLRRWTSFLLVAALLGRLGRQAASGFFVVQAIVSAQTVARIRRIGRTPIAANMHKPPALMKASEYVPEVVRKTPAK